MPRAHSTKPTAALSFRQPVVLLLVVALVPLAVALVTYAARRRREALGLFLGPRASSTADGLARLVRRRAVRAALVVAALACLGVALAGPRFGLDRREARQESLDLLVALDVSESMRTDDVAPSRLERAKLEIERIVEARRGDRVGLVLFAGDAFLQCPLTSDRSAIRLFLDAADPEQVGVQGTDFANALRVASEAFNAAGAANEERPRALVVVSDGEDHEGGLEAAADALRESGVTLLALGIGTDEGGFVPESRRGRTIGFKSDRSGQRVISTYQGGALRAISGGDVVRVGRGSAAPAVNDRLDDLDRAVLASSEFAAYAERYQWPLGLALLLLLAERVVALRPVRQPDGRQLGDPRSDDPQLDGSSSGARQPHARQPDEVPA